MKLEFKIAVSSSENRSYTIIVLGFFHDFTDINKIRDKRMATYYPTIYFNLSLSFLCLQHIQNKAQVLAEDKEGYLTPHPPPNWQDK